MKTDLFQSYGHCWVFQICWHIECSTFTPSPFRIWNWSTGIPSPPLALFVVMLLPKVHLTLHSRMSSCRWVIIPSWLSGSWRSFLYGSSVWASLVAQMVKCLPAMQETRARFLGREDPLEKEIAIHSSTLAWKIPWTKEPDSLQSMGSERVRHDWATSLYFLCILATSS